MGRTRIRPEARRRVVRACERCKTGKRRCDGRNPCGRCTRQHRADDCFYTEVDTHESPRLPERYSSVGRASSLSRTHPTSMVRLERALPDNDELSQALEPTSESNGSQDAPDDARQEQFFVGPSSALSFVKLLENIFHRTTIVHHFETSKNTDKAKENAALAFSRNDLTRFHDRHLLHSYLEKYLTITSGISHVFSETELQQARETDELLLIHSPHSNHQASLYAAIAIGAGANMQTDVDKSYAGAYSEAAEKRLSQGFMLDPDIDTVVASLLMSFYTLIVHRRNAAYINIGYSVRCAHALGLYCSTSDHLNAIWKSVCVLDVAICSILGRPSAVTTTLQDGTLSLTVPDKNRSTVSFTIDKAFEVTKIIDEALKNIYHPRLPRAEDAEVFLHRLTEWRESLPSTFRETMNQRAEATRTSQTDKFSIAKMNLACLYYHGVILITRPFLITATKQNDVRLGNLTSQSVENSRSRQSDAKSLHEQLTEVCTDAAIYLIETVYVTWCSGVLFAHMCFTKAWVFSAGLVLGCSMLTQPVMETQLKPPMEEAIYYLDKESRFSPYAKQYHDILVDIVASIRTIREQQLQQQRVSNIGLLDRVLRTETEHPVATESQPQPQHMGEQLSGSFDWGPVFVNDAQDIFLPAWNGIALEQATTAHGEGHIWTDEWLENLSK